MYGRGPEKIPEAGAHREISRFPGGPVCHCEKDWSCSALDRLLWQIAATGLQTGSLAAAENERSAQELCKCLCKWWPLRAQTVTHGIVYKLLRRVFHIKNFCFWGQFFKQPLLKNCAVDFVEICNVCARKAIIKAAKRIFNSDKICRSYCDFYFDVTFLEHSVFLLWNWTIVL